MIETFFCSDHHLGHKNILEYEKEHRPFETVEEMREVIIDRHNTVVKPKDTVYFLGDFAFGKANIAYAARFNGKKRLVMGNHDAYPTAEYLKYFDKLYGVLYWEQCILSHNPVHPDGLGSRWFLNVHGHLHSRKVQKKQKINLYGAVNTTYSSHGLQEAKIVGQAVDYVDDENYFNVSLEQNNLTPFHRDQIKQRLEELELKEPSSDKDR